MAPKQHSNDIGTRRLTRELLALRRDPIKTPKIIACPLESNILEWHYVIEGSPGTPYEGGYYHGKLLFPKEYPLKPPSVIMCTPSGRFATDRRLCLSMSDFHPESWNPMWSVSTILTGLYSFMLESAPTSGSVESTIQQKRKLAKRSLEYNVRDKVFCQLFPELVALYTQPSEELLRQSQQSNMSSSKSTQQIVATENRPHGQADVTAVLAAAAGLVAVLSIVFAMWNFFI
jgi:ubiquitin-conjugating enzyme E2 J2